MAADSTARRALPRISLTFVIFTTLVIAIVGLILVGKSPWDIIFVNPLLNALVLINVFTLGNFGLAIIVFTILLRLATIPFTIRQLESTKAMQAMQPEMQEIQKKYKDPKRRQEETMRLYREYNINPLGCMMPLLIQFAVFIALYRALVYTVGGSPESLIGLSQRLYPIPLLQEQIPLNQHFLWLNLGQPDTTFLLPILVGVSTYIQQRLTVTPNASPQQQQQQQMLTWMMPLLLMFITLNLPSGVGVYWVVSNVFSLFASYWVYGRRILSWRQLLPVPMEAEPAPAARARKEPASDGHVDAGEQGADIIVEQQEPSANGGTAQRERTDGGKRRGKRKKRR
jgi:YidC/Oxa1 family membrane protein insertase